MKVNPSPPIWVIPMAAGGSGLYEPETTLRLWAAGTLPSPVRLIGTPDWLKVCRTRLYTEPSKFILAWASGGPPNRRATCGLMNQPEAPPAVTAFAAAYGPEPM